MAQKLLVWKGQAKFTIFLAKCQENYGGESLRNYTRDLTAKGRLICNTVGTTDQLPQNER